MQVVLILKKRKGFIKLALQNGANLGKICSDCSLFAYLDSWYGN